MGKLSEGMKGGGLMAREIVDIEKIAEIFSLSKFQVYKLVKREPDPFPARKVGRLLRFDVQKCMDWFDRQPGRDGQ